MKIKKLMAGVLAAAMAVSAAIVAPMTVSADSGTATHTFATPVAVGNWAEVKVTDEEMATALGNSEYIISSIDAVTVNYTADSAVDVTFSHNSDAANSYWASETTTSAVGANSFSFAKPYGYSTGDGFGMQVSLEGNVTIESIEFTCTYASESISAANFTYSVLSNEAMEIGDTFTISYDSTKTPATAKYCLKYAYTLPDAAETTYYTVVSDAGVIDNGAADDVGVACSSATSGNVTTYTFTAKSASKTNFMVNVEYTTLGDWTDTAYPWFGNVSYKVVATDVYPTAIEISGDSAVTVGDTITLTADVTNENGDEITTDTTVTWEADDSGCVSVDEDGVVTGVKVGTATVTASVEGADGAITDTHEITVNAIAVTGISLDKDALALTVGGETGTLTATVVPTNATDKTVTWTSDDTSVATVANGVVTAVASGTATITAKAGEFSDTCEVTVTNPITVISIDATAGVVVGGTKTLTVTTTPTTPDAYTITWTSSDEDVATVANGVVTGVAVGTANITATVDGTAIFDTCAVTVTANTVAVTGVTLDVNTLDLVKGDTATLIATVAPADATNTDVTWLSDAEGIATVDANGKVTAVASGSATITVTTDDGDFTAACVVAVTNPVTKVEITNPITEMTVGDTHTLTATVTPTDADNATVTWTSDKSAVATVDANGEVTAVAAGTATITAKAGDKTATCAITVKEAAVEPEGTAYTYEYDGSPIELTLSVPSWDASQLNGQKNIDFAPAGVTLQTTTFAELKELYSGIEVKDWAINSITEGADESAVSVSIYIQTGSGWSWNAFSGTSVDFADITAIADTDPIMAMGFQINYNATGSDFKAGDVIVINGEEEDLDEGEYSDGTYEELAEEDIPALTNGEADVNSNFVDTEAVNSATYSDGKLYIYSLQKEETIANAESASVVVRYKDGKALKLTSACAYTALTSNVKAEDGWLFLAFVIDGVSDNASDALYYGNFTWSGIEIN